ncbi:MAG TPA: PfkB family carbohydrate kinase, partial [Alphaproteobacteria bacterium]|nr:PfkB family carbohydrate kinase [Alphaproteobacteria bacterium]
MPAVNDAGTVPAGLVLCIGRLYCDLVFTGLDALPSLGRERFARDAAIAPGGGAFITAAHLRGIGRPAALLSRLGTDPVSTALERPLAESGVDLSFLERATDAGPQLTVAIVKDADRAFLSRRAGHACPSTLDAALLAPGARHLHIAEYATLFEIPDLVARAKAQGLSVSLDPSWDDALIHDDSLLDRCAGVDLFLPNAEEARAITKTDDVERALDRMAGRFPLVVIKMGADGALLAAGTRRLDRSAPQVAVVDTTGAGDAFNAGFIDRWIDGGRLEDCLAEAVACGSLSVQAAGGATLLKAEAAT